MGVFFRTLFENVPAPVDSPAYELVTANMKNVYLRALKLNDVVFCTFRPNRAAAITSIQGGVAILEVVSGNNRRSMFRGQFYGYVLANDTVNRTLLIGLPRPSQTGGAPPSIYDYRLQVRYSDLTAGRFYKCAQKVSPQTQLGVLLSRRSIGQPWPQRALTFSVLNLIMM